MWDRCEHHHEREHRGSMARFWDRAGLVMIVISFAVVTYWVLAGY